MKNRNSLLSIIIITFSSMIVFSGCSSKETEGKLVEFKVYGNCEMCKSTIESAAKTDGAILLANWDQNTKIMKVSFDSTKTDEIKIQQAIANAGYDTEREKGSDKAYKSLPECCRYKRK